MAKDYIPQNEGELITWLGNFQVKLGALGVTTFGMTAGEVSTLSGKVTAWITALNDVATKLADYNSAVEAKDEIAKDSEAAIRERSNKFKTHDAYTNDIGVAMGIVSTPSAKPGG